MRTSIAKLFGKLRVPLRGEVVETRTFEFSLRVMATTSAVSLPLCRLAAETTLSEGLIVILLDQDRYGVHIIVGYTDLSPSSYGLEDVYCRAVERCLEDFR